MFLCVCEGVCFHLSTYTYSCGSCEQLYLQIRNAYACVYIEPCMYTHLYIYTYSYIHILVYGSVSQTSSTEWKIGEPFIPQGSF